MCWIDSQSKKLIHLKYVILETSYTIPFSLYSAGILVLRTLNTLPPVFANINNNIFFCLKNIKKMLQYFCACCYSFKKENIYF